MYLSTSVMGASVYRWWHNSCPKHRNAFLFEHRQNSRHFPITSRLDSSIFRISISKLSLYRTCAGSMDGSEGRDEVNDSWTDILFIALCRTAYGNISGFQSNRSWIDGVETYKGMVEVSRSLMKVCLYVLVLLHVCQCLTEHIIDICIRPKLILLECERV